MLERVIDSLAREFDKRIAFAKVDFEETPEQLLDRYHSPVPTGCLSARRTLEAYWHSVSYKITHMRSSKNAVCKDDESTEHDRHRPNCWWAGATARNHTAANKK